jgi:hypothetical protein
VTLAALPPDVETIWWVTLAVGAIVAIVVVVLLQILLNAVKQVERDVITLWETATTVARNTATTWMLANTADALDTIKTEATKHDELLDRVIGP